MYRDFLKQREREKSALRRENDSGTFDIMWSKAFMVCDRV